jgi:hypothetical protein
LISVQPETPDEYKLLSTTAGSAGTNSQTTLFAGGILWIAAVDGAPAGAALVANKLKAAIAADIFMWHSLYGIYMDRFTDQADGSHLGTVADAIPILAVVFVKFFGGILVERFHDDPHGQKFLLRSRSHLSHD